MKKKRAGKRHPGVTSLGGGQYRIRATTTCPKTGKQIERDRTVQARNLNDAAAKRMALLEELRGAGDARASQQSSRLGELATDWLATKTTAKRKGGELRLAPGTRGRYERSVRDFVIPLLGDYRVDRLTRQDVERWRDHLANHYASATVNGHMRVLRAMLRDIGADPRVCDAKPLDIDDAMITDEEPNSLDANEVALFLAQAKKDVPQHYPLMLILATTGTRISTALVLQREDFDPERGEIVARRRRSEKEILQGVKRSRRAVDRLPLLPEVWEAVQAHWARFNDAQLESGLAFPSADGGIRSRSCLNKPMQRILSDVGITKRFTVHGFRRTAAGLYRRAAGSEISMAIAGHLTNEMHRHYAPVGVDEKQAAGREAFKGLFLIDSGDSSGEKGPDAEKPARAATLTG